MSSAYGWLDFKGGNEQQKARRERRKRPECHGGAQTLDQSVYGPCIDPSQPRRVIEESRLVVDKVCSLMFITGLQQEQK